MKEVPNERVHNQPQWRGGNLTLETRPYYTPISKRYRTFPKPQFGIHGRQHYIKDREDNSFKTGIDPRYSRHQINQGKHPSICCQHCGCASRRTAPNDSVSRAVGYATNASLDALSDLRRHHKSRDLLAISDKADRSCGTQQRDLSIVSFASDLTQHIYVSLNSVLLEEEEDQFGTTSKMQVKQRLQSFGLDNGVSVTTASAFVANIQCINNLGKLYSLMETSKMTETELNQEQEPNFKLMVNTNPAFVAKVAYPEAPPQSWSRVRRSLTNSNQFFDSLASNQASLSTNEDSLVTSKLLNLTSYDKNQDAVDEPMEESGHFEKDRDLHSTVLNDPRHENRMSFNELGKIYTNISRKRILSKVQCPNIHFHAHPDGSTTVHRHRTCRRDSNQNEEINDVFYTGSENEKARVIERQDSELSKFSQHVERERYQRTLGRMQYPPHQERQQHYHRFQPSPPGSYPGEEEQVYTSLNNNNHHQHAKTNDNGYYAKQQESPMALCQCEHEVVELPSGVKFNPFYVRELRSREEALMPRALCQVLVDSVLQSGTVANSHSNRSGCDDCGVFAAKLGKDMKILLAKEEFGMSQKGFLDPERALGEHGSGRDWRVRPKLEVQERRIKLMAYFSVVVLAILMLVIVIIIVTLVFSHQPYLDLAPPTTN